MNDKNIEEKAKEVLRLHFGSHYENTFIEPEDEKCTINLLERVQVSKHINISNIGNIKIITDK